METKFTKGEWRVELTNFHDIEGANVFYPHGFLTSANVIKVDETRLEGESWVEMRERTAIQRKANEIESIANMHLIAAAPEMYKFIERLSDLDECQMLKSESKQLLAKARGEK